MANQAANFAYRIQQTWEMRSADAVTFAEQLGAVIVHRVKVPDHWIKEPGDEPGYLMQWPDGSTYIVGQNGHWIAAPKGRGHNVPRYVLID